MTGPDASDAMNAAGGGGQEDPIHFAGSTLPETRHVCAFFDTPEQEDRVIVPFVREGLERGERSYHIVDPDRRSDYVERLEEHGIDATERIESGQFELRDWQEAYLQGGRFDQDAMLEMIQEVLEEGRERGFPLTRLVAHMEWALEDRPGVDDLVEYEARLNYILPQYRDPVI